MFAQNTKSVPLINSYVSQNQKRLYSRDIDTKPDNYLYSIDRSKWLIMFFLIILCLLDALLTMHHLGNGFHELNPILEIALKHGGGLWFFIIKFGTTIPCIIVLFLHSHLAIAKKGIWFLVIIYSLIFIYHLFPFILPIETFEKYLICGL